MLKKVLFSFNERVTFPGIPLVKFSDIWVRIHSMDLITKRTVGHLSKEIAPALIVLFVTVLFSGFFSNVSSIKGWEVLYRVFFRFFRFTLLLCLPLYVLSPIYSFVVNKIRRKLLRTDTIQKVGLQPVKHWIFRPFQGIGIGLLFETKLLGALQIIAGVTTKPFLLSHQSQFQLGRMLISSAITVIISILLAILWTLDDVGIRYVNRKDQEMRMIGKYVGTVMPILFGLYGILSLVADFPSMQVFSYLLKTIIILYPPFMVFTIFHAHFVQNRATYFSQKASLKEGGIW